MNAKERLRTLEECSRAKNAKITVQFDLNSKRLIEVKIHKISKRFISDFIRRIF